MNTTWMWKDGVVVKPPLDWEILQSECLHRAMGLKLAWNIDWPRRGTLPSAALERRVDIPCEMLAQTHVLRPPALEDEQPWILARLEYAAFRCGQFWQQDPRPALANREETMKLLLVHEWHTGGRRYWKRKIGDQLS